MLSASVLANSMKTSDEYSGCKNTSLITSTRKNNKMRALSSLIQYIKYLQSRRARRKQKLTALQMLAHSGVVRRSHVELHYLAPVARNPASRAHPAAIGHQLIHNIPFRSLEHDKTQTPQWARSLSSSIVQLLEHRSLAGPSS